MKAGGYQQEQETLLQDHLPTQHPILSVRVLVLPQDSAGGGAGERSTNHRASLGGVGGSRGAGRGPEVGAGGPWASVHQDLGSLPVQHCEGHVYDWHLRAT